MARRCGCASDECSCIINGGTGIVVTGAGSPRNPYIINSTVAEIETGIDVEYNNADVVNNVHGIDFRGTGVSVTGGADEAIVTINLPDPTTGALIPPGSMSMYAGNVTPTGWLPCDGATLPIASYPGLFAAISTRYGGDGTTNFKVPNMVGVFPIGTSGAYPVDGLQRGSSTKSLGEANLPPHAHSINHSHGAVGTSGSGSHKHSMRMANAAGGNDNYASKGTSASWNLTNTPMPDPDGFHSHSVTIPDFGGSSGNGNGSAASFDIMPPYLAVAFIIKT